MTDGMTLQQLAVLRALAAVVYDLAPETPLKAALTTAVAAMEADQTRRIIEQHGQRTGT